MKTVKFVGTIVGLCIGYIVLVPLGVKEEIVGQSSLFYLLLTGIIVSGYLSYRYAKQDRDMEQRFIELEGEVIMDEIRKRREQTEA